jgi:UDP-N-acetylmuramoyl-L-alanine---L-glutamate ligase
MNEFLKSVVFQKKVCILGFGAEGQSCFETLRKYFPDQQFTIADKNSIFLSHPLLNNSENVLFIVGEDYLKNLDEFDLIIKTPGIPYNQLSHIDPEKITSQTELFIRMFRDKIIGITGTKGKSTTSSLIYHILHQQTKNVVLVGNIGVPPFEMLERIDQNTHIVYELSSHQLEQTRVSPHIAILLNLFEEHLDHYTSFADYQLAKFNITRFQYEKDFFIYHFDDQRIRILLDEVNSPAVRLPFSLQQDLQKGCKVYNQQMVFNSDTINTLMIPIDTPFKLKGEHNLLNIMAAISASTLCGISEEIIKKGIPSFVPLEHRLEFVGTFDKVDFYNDSIATIPEASMAAIKAIGNVDTVILGGYDRGVDYTGFVEFLILSDVKNLIFMGAAGLRMMEQLQKNASHVKKIFFVKDLKEAVGTAKKQTAPEKACLLSPAAASYDMFSNFAERGKAFKNLVEN